jgi:hypothetical protein
VSAISHILFIASNSAPFRYSIMLWTIAPSQLQTVSILVFCPSFLLFFEMSGCPFLSFSRNARHIYTMSYIFCTARESLKSVLICSFHKSSKSHVFPVF